MKPSEVLFKIGGTVWLIAAGGSLVIILLHWFGALDASSFPWKPLWALFGAGGLAAMVAGGVFSIWEP